MKRWAVTSFVFAVASIAPWQSACAELPYQLAWARQFGTSGVDYGFFTAVDYAGNVLVVGGTEGSLGAPNAGETDVFLTKYDPAGNLQWMKQFGSQGNEFTEGMTVDPSGNVYITGFTYGSLGGPQIGNGDAFLTKFDQSGNLLWSKQVGTTSADGGEGIAIDPGGNVILTGFTFGALNGPNAGSADGFLRKYDGSGNILWAKQFGTPRSDSGSDVVADSFGNVLVAGEQQVSGVGLDFSKYDASLWKFDGDGNQLWQRQFGTDYLDAAIDIALDPSGNAVILGSTNRSNAVSNRPSQFDAFVWKYDSAGNTLWNRHIATDANETARGIAADAFDSVFVFGWTEGALGGPNAGESDLFLIKYDRSGTALWTKQLGTIAGEFGGGAAVDAVGNAYVSGGTYGALGGVNLGSEDALLIKFAVPEPSGLVLFTSASMSAGFFLWRRRRLKSSPVASAGRTAGCSRSGQMSCWLVIAGASRSATTVH